MFVKLLSSSVWCFDHGHDQRAATGWQTGCFTKEMQSGAWPPRRHRHERDLTIQWLLDLFPVRQMSVPSSTDEEAHTPAVFQAPAPPSGVCTARLYADGSMRTATMLAKDVWQTDVVPCHFLEAF